MKLNHDLFFKALEALDEKLVKLEHEPIELRVCGAGALSIVGVISRATRDLDVITPKLTDALLRASEEVADYLLLPKTWINNGPASLTRDLESGWEDRCVEIYNRKVIRVLALGRRDLIASKLFAFCDRDENDLDDLIAIKPSVDEIDSLLNWVLDRDGSELWPNRVRERFSLLKSRIQND